MGKRTPFDFVKDQFVSIPSIGTLKTDLSGRTIVVVGASSGIGLEAARHLAGMKPAKLILACRDIQKGETALDSILRTTKPTAGEVWKLDLLSFASIQAFADEFERKGVQQIDLLVLNAGINTEIYKKSSDGYESVLQTNHIANAFLSILLLPYLLRATSQSSPALPRLVLVNTDGHYWANVSKDEMVSDHLMQMLSDEQYCDAKVMGNRYNISKLISLLFTRSLASRISSSSGLVVTSMTPGWVRSALNRDLTFPLTMVNAIFSRIFGRTAEAGGRIVVHACVGTCTTPDRLGTGKEMHGHFVCKCQVIEESDFAVSPDGRIFEQKVWDDTVAILSAVDNRIPLIISQYLSNAE